MLRISAACRAGDPAGHAAQVRLTGALLLLGFILAGAGASAATSRVAADPSAPPPRHPALSARTFPERTPLDAKGDGGFAVGAKTGDRGETAVVDDSYDVLRYRLDITIDPADRDIAGRVEIVLSSRRSALDTLVFDLHRSLTVTGIDSATPVADWTHVDDALTVALTADLAEGGRDSLTIHFAGTPVEPRENRGLMFRTYDDHGFDGGVDHIVANMSEPAFASAWWPCKDRPDDKALLEMKVTVPTGLTAVSNGTFVGQETVGDWTSWSWRFDYPIPPYLVSVAISDYVELFEQCSTSYGSEIPLYNWVFPHLVDEATDAFGDLCDWIDRFEGYFGPYPFAGEKYGHALWVWPGAMEHSTVTSLKDERVENGTARWIIIHELAHQWFGDSLTPRTWQDIWLNEGFATYAEALDKEWTGGRAGYLDSMYGFYRRTLWELMGPVYDPYPDILADVVYSKGAWILHMLRGRLGDDDFFALLYEWATGGDRPFGTVITEEFIALANLYSDEPLDDFFWPYLDEAFLPRIAFVPEIEAGSAGPDTRLTVNLRQVQSPLFDNVFPVRVITGTVANPETTTVRVPLRTTTASQNAEFAAPILDVTLDPEGWVAWEDAGALPVVTNSLSLVYPNPARESVTLRYRLGESAPVSYRIYDVRGRLLKTQNLGTVAADAAFNEHSWFLQDDDGRPVPSGVYWIKLTVGGIESVRRFTVIQSR